MTEIVTELLKKELKETKHARLFIDAACHFVPDSFDGILVFSYGKNKMGGPSAIRRWITGSYDYFFSINDRNPKILKRETKKRMKSHICEYSDFDLNKTPYMQFSFDSFYMSFMLIDYGNSISGTGTSFLVNRIGDGEYSYEIGKKWFLDGCGWFKSSEKHMFR